MSNHVVVLHSSADQVAVASLALELALEFVLEAVAARSLGATLQILVTANLLQPVAVLTLNEYLAARIGLIRAIKHLSVAAHNLDVVDFMFIVTALRSLYEVDLLEASELRVASAQTAVR